jgi:hypothetical protein
MVLVLEFRDIAMLDPGHQDNAQGRRDMDVPLNSSADSIKECKFTSHI